MLKGHLNYYAVSGNAIECENQFAADRSSPCKFCETYDVQYENVECIGNPETNLTYKSETNSLVI